MVRLFLTCSSQPLTEAMELTQTLPAQVAAVVIGALIGVTLFVLAVVVARQKSRDPVHDLQRDVVVVSPYPTGAALTLPPQPVGMPGGRFAPSTALSARAFAKMGYAFDEEAFDTNVAVASGPSVFERPIELPELPDAPIMSAPSQTTSPSSSMSGPSGTKRFTRFTASIIELDLDDAPTQLCEPIFETTPSKSRALGA